MNLLSTDNDQVFSATAPLCLRHFSGEEKNMSDVSDFNMAQSDGQRVGSHEASPPLLFSSSCEVQATLSQSLLAAREDKQGDAEEEDAEETGGGRGGEYGDGAPLYTLRGGADAAEDEEEQTTVHRITTAATTRSSFTSGSSGGGDGGIFTCILVSKVLAAVLAALLLLGAVTHLEAVGTAVKAVLAKVGDLSEEAVPVPLQVCWATECPGWSTSREETGSSPG